MGCSSRRRFPPTVSKSDARKPYRGRGESVPPVVAATHPVVRSLCVLGTPHATVNADGVGT